MNLGASVPVSGASCPGSLPTLGTQLLSRASPGTCPISAPGTRGALSASMPKQTSRSKRALRASADKSATTDIVTQLECAVRRPQATLIGALVGGVVPWFARTLAHQEVPAAFAA